MNGITGKTRRRVARDRYKPHVIEYLLIAEAPPSEDRYFYFDDVSFADNLFAGTMEILFPDLFSGYIGSRSPRQKQILLKRLQSAGFWLLDAVDSPLAHSASRSRIREISDLPQRLLQLRDAGEVRDLTPVIFMKANVYRAFYDPLKELGFNVVSELVYFPGNGRQNDFRRMFPKALARARYKAARN